MRSSVYTAVRSAEQEGSGNRCDLGKDRRSDDEEVTFHDRGALKGTSRPAVGGIVGGPYAHTFLSLKYSCADLLSRRRRSAFLPAPDRRPDPTVRAGRYARCGHIAVCTGLAAHQVGDRLGLALRFGLGMQLGNGWGSGTLFTLGGGNTQMMITLIFFCVGSFWGSLDMLWWNNTPRLDAIVLG